MGQIASRSQLNMSFFRTAVVTVPLVLLLGVAAGRLSNSGNDNAWFAALEKPASFPPTWAFGLVWSILYVMLGLALASVINARGNRAREVAVALFGLQFAINLTWSPLFFALHQVSAAFWLILAMIVAAVATTFAFGVVRRGAAWLMVPYLAWLCFAAGLNHDFDRLNPDAEMLVPGSVTTQISS